MAGCACLINLETAEIKLSRHRFYCYRHLAEENEFNRIS
jgi:hypothetical protein